MTEPIEPSTETSSECLSDMPIARVSRKQTWRASVSLEFDLQPNLTWRGEVQKSSPSGAANAAIKAARKAFAGKKPRNWVIVLEKA
jgi:hypothetical protein